MRVKNTILIFLAFWLLNSASFAGAQETPRVRYTINDEWKFLPNDLSGAEKQKLDDGTWQKVMIPHTWNAEDAFDDEPGYRRGASWYRRELSLNSNLRNKRIYLYFEGANHTAEVFVNEQRAGLHIGGYTAFVFDVTDLISFEKSNIIAVKVDNTLDEDKPPISGDFTMYGGIYRDVWLVAADEIHFKITDHASPGIKIETPQVSEVSATVRISGTVSNDGENKRNIEIVSTIFDAANRSVNTLTSNLQVEAGSEAVFEQTGAQIANPKLWSPASPNLYKVQTVVRENGKILDEIVNPLGFRWFHFDAAEGFFLNGKYLKLRGTNRHQDYKGLGNAVPDNLQVRDLEIIKENGFNFVRLAHYPQDPAVLEAADRLGILLWEEVPVVNQIHVSEKFNENARMMLTEMIRQHRNHPSIIIWGFMNEVFLPVPKSDETVRATVELAKALEQICKTEDAGRTTAIAFDHGARELYHTSGLDKVTDITGWNLYHGWYYETFEDFGKFLDEEHGRFPDRPLIISEYGANGDRRVHSLAPKRFDSSIEWQRMYHEAYLPQINSRKFLAGAAIWNQFDFGSEFRGETIPHINQKGMFTYDRKPKDVSYFYKANFSTEPVLHIAARDWPVRGGEPTATIDVYSNLQKIELFVNGRSLGKKTPGEYKKASWEIGWKDGKNSLLVQAFQGRVMILDETEVFYKSPADLTEIAVNAGSNAEYIDEGRTVWQADRPYKTGSWGYLEGGTKADSTGRNIWNTTDDQLFQTVLEGMSAYRFDVPDGDYEIELRFAETKFETAGQRVFDVQINGKLFLEKLDLASESGFLKSFTRKFRLSAQNGRGISVEFKPRTGQPLVSGLHIKKVL